MANLQLLCHACNQLKDDGPHRKLMAELRAPHAVCAPSTRYIDIIGV